MVYLPADYAARGRPDPVIYYLQGLPSGPTAYRGFGYLARTLNQAKENAILVVPQVSRIAGTDPEYLDWSSTDDWPMAISHDLTQCIDRRYNTIASRRGRALMGVSAGGFGAFNIGFRHLRTFAAVESWSGYFAATDPTGTHVLNLGSAKANAAARVPYGASMRSSLARWPSLLGFFVGQADSELATNERFDQTLSAGGIRHVFDTYPGGHSHPLWAREAPAWLAMALNFLGTVHR